MPPADLIFGLRIRRWLLASCWIGIVLSQDRAGEPLPANLFHRWIHSYEEDTSETCVFRLADYSFPPSRGRDGFDIHSDGKFSLFGPGGNDRGAAWTGHWTRSGARKLLVRFLDKTMDREIQILEVNPDLLRIKR